jgi:hypothetical protein
MKRREAHEKLQSDAGLEVDNVRAVADASAWYQIGFLNGAGFGLGSFRRRSRWIPTDNQASFPHTKIGPVALMSKVVGALIPSNGLLPQQSST